MGSDENKIRAIIVDDEMPARENLRFMLNDYCPDVEVVGTADGVKNALELFQKEKPDLIFLDIRMPSGAEGFDLLSKLSEENFYVVFVTAFKEYAIRAFENRALHYILKPIDETDLIETVNRLKDRMSSDLVSEEGAMEYRESLKRIESEVQRHGRPRRLTIHHSKGIKIIDPDDITHLEGSGNCSILHFSNQSQYFDTRTLKIYEVLLDQSFFRIHKSFIVNLKEVAEILHGDEQVVVLKNGSRIPVSRERKKELIDRISELL